MSDVYANIERRFVELLPEYADELDSVAGWSTKLFPTDVNLTEKELDNYRSLCAHSQNTLKKIAVITSHRKVVGPVIVFFKKILWNILNSQLKDTFQGINHYFSQMLLNQARLDVEIRRLKNNK